MFQDTKFDNPLYLSVIKEVVHLDSEVADKHSEQAELQDTDLQSDTDYSKTDPTPNNGKDDLILTCVGCTPCRRTFPLNTKNYYKYYSFFYPHLIYSVELWLQAADTNLREIKVIQKNALRVKAGNHISFLLIKHKMMPVL